MKHRIVNTTQDDMYLVSGDIFRKRTAVIEAAEACVHGYDCEMPDGSIVHVEPFDPETCHSLQERVRALQEVTDGDG